MSNKNQHRNSKFSLFLCTSDFNIPFLPMDFEGAKKFILQKQNEELPADLAYHDILHVEDVYRVTLVLGEMEKLDTRDQNLVSMAALFHDSGFILNRNNHEEVSCEFARKYLPGFGFTMEDTETICKIILATRMPVKPTTLLEQIICDADLDYLGRDDFELISSKLYHELFSNSLVNSVQEFDSRQILFFESHQYHTQSANQMRKAKKEENLQIIKSRIVGNH
jgi:hypothetical protein